MTLRALTLVTAVSLLAAPGAGFAQGTKERLSEADILIVIRSHSKPLRECVTEQKRRNPSLGGTLRIQWTIQPNGKTRSVGAAPEQFRSTYLASCVVGLVKGWNFPPHRVQGEAVDLPITF
ncbi:hypothetical protein BWI17_02105 [Betaproteobacteria bacterium GR16-43]|nr:hypothetical protein BWI17_02105 [Betaproteobacteria bacterium GR16-43]